MSKGIALIDGDICCWKAACSAEYSVYDLAEDESTFRYKRDLTDFINANWEEDEASQLHNCAIQRKILEPLGKAYKAASQIIDSCLNAVGTDKYEVYLSGKTNFRNSIPYPVKYKGNRTQPKPLYFSEVRNYLKDTFGAVEADNMETDDMLSIRQRELGEDSIICSIDKDLLQVPGKHYHMDRKEIITITKLEGFRNLGVQLLTGDTADNILGIDGIGPKTAKKILKDCTTEDEIYNTVVDQYKKAWPGEWEDLFQANLQLLMLKAVA